MIPPCDPTILNNNPQFKALHQHLTTTILNPDGSTQALDAEPSRRGVKNVGTAPYLQCFLFVLQRITFISFYFVMNDWLDFV